MVYLPVEKRILHLAPDRESAVAMLSSLTWAVCFDENLVQQ